MGLLSEIFGKIPDVGEIKEFNGYSFTILKKVDQNIESVKLQLLIEEEDQIDNVQNGDDSKGKT